MDSQIPQAWRKSSPDLIESQRKSQRFSEESRDGVLREYTVILQVTCITNSLVNPV